MTSSVDDRKGFEPMAIEGLGKAEFLTVKETQLARHALGLNRGRTVNRNFFICPDSHAEWNRMVDAGYAMRGREGPNGGDRVFRVTKAGIQAVILPGEKCDEEYLR